MSDTRHSHSPSALVTDLDGTLIPLPDNPQHRLDLDVLVSELQNKNATLVFSTGRHFASVERAIAEFRLPQPEWMICDVGTSIRHRTAAGQFELVTEYEAYLDAIIQGMSVGRLRTILASIEGLRPQEDEKQGAFKLSYYAIAAQLAERVGEIQERLEESKAPFSIVHSIDPFNGDGLIDLLPSGISKAHALSWWRNHVGLDAEDVVFAGDSGNDLAALVSGCRAILVNNAHRDLARQVYEQHRDQGWTNRLHLARASATSGVLEGARWFGLAAQLPDAEPPIGATPVSCDTTTFRVWAPKRQQVSIETSDENESTRYSLVRSESGYFTATIKGVGPGANYQYVLDEHVTRPDPVSRYQPKSVHGRSRVVNPNSFPWTDQTWTGVRKRDLVIYELHVGAFTSAGTFSAAIDRLDELVDLGVTAVELMPVTQSPGRWNWGYDGVGLYAVRNTYGTPDEMKAFVDACHAKRIAVILDVVYNHLGPEGNYLSEFGPYFSRKHRTPWGEALNFDGRHARPVREFVIQNAIYWLDEYHLDGLRLDAIHFMIDNSTPSIVDEIRTAVTQYETASSREIHLIAESNLYDDELLSSNEHRAAYDASWCDCLMHAIYSFAVPDLRLTTRKYHGAADVAAALQAGFVFQGKTTGAKGYHRVAAIRPDQDSAPVESFVIALQTHDSVGNHPHGKRIHHLTSKPFQQAAAALFLLYPSIPMIFMGEETASDAPFPFFVDFHDQRLRKAVDRGRRDEYTQHDWHGAILPSSEQAFLAAKCEDADRLDENMRRWYRSLIELRKTGIAEGWLCKDRLRTECDEPVGLFTLRYSRLDHGEVIIRTRLSPPAKSRDDLLTIDNSGTILLSSAPIAEQTNKRLALGSNQAVVTQTD